MDNLSFGHAPILKTHYKVLARKYRPHSLKELIGQDVLVKTLSNAIRMNRMPHAIILTGIRGVGKTTTARIIAKLLNCEQLQSENTIYTSCGVCHNCVSIFNGTHPDVLELDAASHTGINDVRPIIENAHYKASSGNYRVYIIDEIHMLSTSAFNALLKTLEEPPQHLVFIFATTEIQKIPLTILSRCQRFDLKRIPNNVLKKHYQNILQLENIEAEDHALELIVAASDGSVRDGLSILDQAIALSDARMIQASLVRDMLCIINTTQVTHIFILIAEGSVHALLDLVHDLYDNGMDAILLVNQLLELVNAITKYKILQKKEALDGFPEDIFIQSRQLSLQYLSRLWQMLLKGLEEIKNSPRAIYALEMLFIRICYFNMSFTPEKILKANDDNTVKTEKASITQLCSKTAQQPATKIDPIDKIEDLFSLLYERNELEIYQILHNDVAIISFSNNIIKINLLNCKVNRLKALLEAKLKEITSQDWKVEVVDTPGSTIAINKKNLLEDKKKFIMKNDLVQEVLNHFTGSQIIDIKSSE